MNKYLLKALIWETFSTLLIFLLAWVVFRNVEVCLFFTIITFCIKVIFYYIYEHTWNYFNNKKSFGILRINKIDNEKYYDLWWPFDTKEEAEKFEKEYYCTHGSIVKIVQLELK